MRAFVGLEIPEPTSSALVAEIRSARELLPAARWIPPSKWHLTLAFLGESEEPELGDLARALTRVIEGRRAFELVLSGFGVFPPRGRGKVAWAGLEPSKRLADLRRAVVETCRDRGYAIDRKPFAGHVTLARSRRPWRRSEREAWLTEVDRGHALAFEARRVCLFESILEASGARYRALAEFPLAGGTSS